MLPTLDEAAKQLSASGNYRVLRRVPPVEAWALPSPVGEVVRSAIVDVEATGLGDADEVIELAIVPFDYCRASGQVVAVHMDRAFQGCREPSVPITEESQRVHRITPEMVAGKVITPEQVDAAMSSVQLVIAHNAGYDRAKCEMLWPLFENLAWACSCEDVKWRAEGFETSALKWLLVSQGYYHEGHRAMDDALATLFLLTLPLSDRIALSALLEQARKPLTMVQAVDTNFDHRDLLKARGYRWEPGGNGRIKAWVLASTDPDAEVEWLKSSSCWQRGTRVALRAVPAKLRYSQRVWSGA